MPHQCLNCGRMIEKGSREILRGCNECGGKKFMFVDTPLPREERESLKRKADRVRNEMMKKADPEFIQLLKDKGIGSIGGAQVEMDRELGDDWVRVQYENKTGMEISQEDTGPTTELARPSGSRPSAKDLISQFDRKLDDRKGSDPSATGEKGADEGKPTKRRGKRGTGKEARTGPVPKKDRKGKRSGKQIDVINIVEQGVYEIDVKRLLEDNPIVIQKDGSYLIHLPSLFKEGRERSKK
ncbi:MAG: hypothetical protein JXA22_07515 [Candidatus Thermoplasmatota archaeon]|nr:hypothetical protein [Candidatus Thermoplasmatota archaeon]